MIQRLKDRWWCYWNGICFKHLEDESRDAPCFSCVIERREKYDKRRAEVEKRMQCSE